MGEQVVPGQGDGKGPGVKEGGPAHQAADFARATRVFSQRLGDLVMVLQPRHQVLALAAPKQNHATCQEEGNAVHWDVQGIPVGEKAPW